MNFEKATMLLMICDKSKNWPNLRYLHDAAMAELMAIQSPKIVVKEPEPEPEIEAEPALDRRL